MIVFSMPFTIFLMRCFFGEFERKVRLAQLYLVFALMWNCQELFSRFSRLPFYFARNHLFCTHRAVS